MTGNLQPPYRYAGFGIRFAAFLIDSLLIGVIILPLLIHYYGWEYLFPKDFIFKALSNPGSFSLTRGLLDILLSYVFPALVVIIFWLYRSATPGKMILRITIIDAKTGAAPSLRQCIIRYLGYYVSLIPFGLGFIWIAVSEKKQGWHDLLANTYVVYRK